MTRQCLNKPDLKMSKTNIYVLRLIGGNYYVGRTGNVMKRFQQHVDGYGSAWTKKHKPVSLEKTYENVSTFDEDKITKMYMSKYGVDKVRGGSYVEIRLNPVQKEFLNIEIRSAKDCCTQCGRYGHYVKDCYTGTGASGNKIAYEMKAKANAKSTPVCYRCGRAGHLASECYARTHDKGYTLDSDYDNSELDYYSD
jgi:predicted GIY-YIG superfamily endonuclease